MKHLYEYAVIRVVPRVEREEFFNVGIILYCKSLGFLAVDYAIDPQKFAGFCSGMEVEDLNAYLQSFRKIAAGEGPIGALPVAERFRWLSATRSTVVQTSRIHPGLTEDPAKKLRQLMQELVEPFPQ
jgi:hypothetical protein